MRREIPLMITAVVGLFMILQFFVPFPLIRDSASEVQEWFLVIAAFAIVLGVGNLIRVNLHRVRRKGEDWGYKVVTLVALIGFAIVGLVLDVQLDIRKTWITRSLGLVAADEVKLLEGRQRLPSRQAEMAFRIADAPDEARRAEILGEGFGLSPDQAKDLAKLGADGIRALVAADVYAALRAEWDKEKEDRDRRTEEELEGRLIATGLLPVLGDVRKQDGAHRTLREMGFTWDQADDLLAASQEELGKLTHTGLAAAIEDKRRDRPKERIAGRRMLLSRQEAILAVLATEGPPGRVEAALVDLEGIDPELVATDLVALGPDGVRSLDSDRIMNALRAESDLAQKKILRGRLEIAGRRKAVLSVLAADAGDEAKTNTLIALLRYNDEQAKDLLALGSDGVAAVTLESVESDLAALVRDREGEVRNSAYWVFDYVYTPLQATMFSLLAFFIASAAFRAFRMRSVEAGLLLGAGLLVILGRVPLGQFDWGIAEADFGFHTIMQWIMNVPTTAAMRGIKMGAAMGVIVMGLKVILGIERSYLGGD